LVALIVVPGLANTLNITRFYHILLFFLAPLCILGAGMFVEVILKRRTAMVVSILLVIVLVPYFLFQTSFVYEVVGAQSYNLPLSEHRISLTTLRWNLGYFDESEQNGASWMSKTVNVENSNIYSDGSSAYGLLRALPIEVLTNTTVLSANATVYLNRANIVDETIMGQYSAIAYYWNTTSLMPNLGLGNVIYSNGGCEIYKMTSNP
jgi:uncharacterized membrane protein